MLKIIVSVGIALFISGCGSRFKEYDYLKEPKINTIPTQKMMVVEVKGDPKVTGGKAIKTMYNAFFQLKRSIKGLKMFALRARWPKPLDTPKDEWIGIYGIPIPEEVNSLPKSSESQIKIEYWEYGTVAEILHTGPYSQETPTIERLHQFIKDNGYKIVGSHEEEYLKGPGMFSMFNNPAKYKTIIRYSVEKVE
ncbi:MAG: GyrI-like domain-containing protein [Candidatus Stahlbacteria bacterium]|nr:GyrI-like domain-containing protein [Candidatus Stahlbacteria bacterium]